MQKLVFINGGGQTIDLTSGNFGITNWEGLSGVGLNIQTQQVPFQDGGVFLDALMEQREISVTVAIQDNNDLSARYERKRQLISALNPKLGEGVLVYTNDYLSRQIKAVPQLPIFENKNSNDAGTLKANVTFSCPSPYWEDLEDTVVDLGLSEIKTINNEGDVPTQVEISLLGESVNPNIVNNTTGQNIQYIGTMNGKININTNFGKKGAIKITEGTDIVISRAELDFIKCIYVSRYGKYFAIFENGCFGSSQDGIQWQIKKVANGLHIYDFCYSLEKNIFVLVGEEIITSSDAENWKYIDTTNTLYGVTYNADTGDFVATGQTVSYKSTDGENWERAFVLATILDKITTNGQIYVVVVSGTGYVKTSTNGTSYSTNYATGITSITQIFYSEKNNLFVVIGTGGEIATSTNGTSWTTRTSGTTQNLNNISEDKSGNIFVVGENGTVLKSTNGTSWSSVDSGVSATLNTFVTNGSIDEYIIGGNGFIILKSYDLENWEDYELEATDFKSCTYCKNIGKYVVVGTGGIIMSSRDGMLWNKETSPVNTDLLSVCYSEQKKIIVAVGANGRIITSTNAENWTIRNTNIASQLNEVLYDPTREKFFVAGNDNKVLTSQDAENWTTQTVGTGTKDFISIATSNNMILLLTELFIFKSTDGNTFTQTINIWGIGIGTGKAVIYHKVLGVFAILVVASNYSGAVITKDGENYTSTLIANSILGNNMFYSEELNQAFVVANYGNILKSSDLYNWSSIRNTVIKNLYGASFSNIKDLIFCGEDNSIIDITGEKEENVIQNISLTSDFGFRLNQGENKLTLLENSGVLSAQIKYRQKYIGV